MECEDGRGAACRAEIRYEQDRTASITMMKREGESIRRLASSLYLCATPDGGLEVNC